MKFSLKTFLLTIFIIAEMAALSAFASVVPPVINSTENTPELSTMLRPRVSISFTIARRRDCMGFGICVWEASITWERNGVNGVIYADDAVKNRMIIEIDKTKGISYEVYEKYFQSGMFFMEDDSPVPSEVLAGLGIKGPRTIPAGKHPVTERSGILYVSVPVN